MIPNLNKENFWDELERQFPDAVKRFYDWIDEYKIEAGWDKIFKCNEGTGQVVKFHEVPVEIQMGIISRFLFELTGSRAGDKNLVLEA